jgi:hypothetical protein
MFDERFVKGVRPPYDHVLMFVSTAVGFQASVAE